MDQNETTVTLPGISDTAEQAAGPEQMTRVQRDPVPADRHGWWWGTGRRKTAVARVRMRPATKEGEGAVRIQINRKKFKVINEYFTEERDRNDAIAPLKISDMNGKMDVVVRLGGGGFMGQAQALRLGLARAIRNYDPTLEEKLRDEGFLTRDAREVERKKYGQPGARARFQFSKR